jgi:general secretion pathway protein A
MYENFFGLRVKPFNLTPNPDFLYLSKTHREVYAHLLYGIQGRVGFIEVTGEVGTGKTTILRTILNDLDPDTYRVALVFNPKLTSIELLRTINHEFGIASQAKTSSQLVDVLNRFLLDENRAGRVPVLVIDEAQNLSGDVLEQIRLLSNLETATEKLIQIVLAGQPELGQVLSRPELRQLDQRIAVRYHLTPLDLPESCDYVRHRLSLAGRPDGEVFAPPALKLIHRISDGVPRLINILCDRALLVGYSEGVGRLTRREVLQASRELKRGDRADDRQRKWFYMVAVAGLLVVLGLVWQMRLISLSPPSVGNDVSAATGSGVLQSDRSPGSVPKGAQE